MITEREKRLIEMTNMLLISLDKIAVSRDMGATRAEAIRAIEAYQEDWRFWKKEFLSDIPQTPIGREFSEKMEFDGTLVPIYRPVRER